jgi:hypothetical protein
MSEEDIEKLSAFEVGRNVHVDGLEVGGEVISGDFRIVSKEKVSVDDLADKVLQALLYPGNSRVTEVVIRNMDTRDETTVVVNLEEMEAAIR